ncbi:uncharacterized protein N7484_011422 [Penicillium longicatenatum]|uniref:uncharacterized protein n=1 Tax=Penicillium longicatenatum TaxID=1561947 RepID=UPI00254734DE|nr:uncharacterized protein N7484_011422 [Penicillium longicatenatum]KAJ5631322.1 hypothetical protein N7484_011422 [Penicillium longicatenatum]
MGSELGITASTAELIDLSPVSIWWATWACVWTLTVVSGATFLIINRNAPTLRIRGLGLSLSAIGLLHLYWAVCQFGTMIGAILPGDAQYWIMGTFLPLGLSLFHASNARFLHVAKLQKKYAQYGHHLFEIKPEGSPKGLINHFRALRYNTKVFIIVGIGMFIQLFLTILMWIISRKFHSSWGIPGTEVHGSAMAQKTAQGSGWEWWPGVAYQLLWAWVIAPIVLWKSRKINDTQGWRTQTIGCALANLHGTPMWLIGLYVPAMAPVNAVWIPPQWICLSIWFMEIFTIFIPCYEVFRSQTLRKETLDSIARWELKVKSSGSEEKSLNSASTMVESFMSGWKSTNDSIQSNGSRDSIMTMHALEHEFSALREFSGENIAFLTGVSEWKNSLPAMMKDGFSDESSKGAVRESFNRALHLYAKFISVRHAEFPLNISSQDLASLDHVFEKPTRLLYGDERETNPVSPFNKFTFDLPSPSLSDSSEKGLKATSTEIKDRVQYWGQIPEEFSATVFDDAEKSIKYLVLTNTWPKFIKDRRTSIESFETLKPGMDV